MRPVLLDTNAYSAFKKNNSDVIQIIQHAEQICISPVVLGELLSGFDGGNKAKKNRMELQEFLESSRVKIYTITSDTANFYCQIFSALKMKGKPIPTNDIWIAAQALEYGCVICTFDAHFQLIEGLLTGTCLSDLLL